MPAGKRRNALVAAMREWLALGFGQRILSFDSAAARAYAEIAGRVVVESAGPIGEADCQIAAISRSRGGVLVTRNVRDFEGTDVELVDPWTMA